MLTGVTQFGPIAAVYNLTMLPLRGRKLAYARLFKILMFVIALVADWIKLTITTNQQLKQQIFILFKAGMRQIFIFFCVQSLEKKSMDFGVMENLLTP